MHCLPEIVLLLLVICLTISANPAIDKSVTDEGVDDIEEIDEENPLTDCFVSDNDQELTGDDNKISTLSPTELSRVLIEGSHAFAFDLLKALHKFQPKDNSTGGLLLSPSSVWSTLIITYMAAKGETERELRNRLRLNTIAKSSVGLAYQGLRLWNDLKKNMSKMSANGVSEKAVVSQANRIFINNELQLNSCFAEYFDSDVVPMNFSTSPRQSMDQINDWVAELTANKITDLIPNGAITPWTKMIIANAVYFQAKWLNQFPSEATRNQTFYVSPTDEIQVPLMTTEATVMYGISERLQATAIDLPYANPDYSMVVILPDVGKGLDSMIATITPADLYELVANMYDDEVTIQLPKFKVEQQFELAGPLYSIGIRKLFDPRFADLSSLFAATVSTNSSSDTNNTTKSTADSVHNSGNADGFALNSVVHKTYITCDEEGTEAAAATAMIYGRSGRPVFQTQFVANRPFLYLIRDVATNFILFMGTVRRPMQ